MRSKRSSFLFRRPIAPSLSSSAPRLFSPCIPSFASFLSLSLIQAAYHADLSALERKEKNNPAWKRTRHEETQFTKTHRRRPSSSGRRSSFGKKTPILTSLRRRKPPLHGRSQGVDARAEPPQGRAQQAQGRGGRLGGHFSFARGSIPFFFFLLFFPPRDE